MKNRFLFLIILFIMIPQLSNAQYFGKNKVQYSNFNWQYIQSEHFDVYFTNGGEDVAAFTADEAETHYETLKRDFRFALSDRITIIVHNSHNDFEQTNVDLSPPEESVGGFTEFFKNRVVVPFEGEWEQFRHVIHHELTHAVMLQMVYGSGVQSIITGLAQLSLPLWLVEGLAEYKSRGWDFESDMYMRDAAINGYAPDIPYLSGFLAYKGGQSVLQYLAETKGEEKIGELLGNIKINKSVERGLKKSIGLNEEELSKRWKKYLKTNYWPDLGTHKDPEDFARRLTNHTKDKNFINISPALSPKGDKIAFLTDKYDYFDIYLLSAIDGKILSKLVSGQKTANLEELHWLKGPGISWSPDAKYIVFSAKAGEGDVLNIVDVKHSKIIKTLEFDLDGVFNPSWSPDGNYIVFSGILNGQGDIYLINLETEKVKQLTDDLFSDVEPTWSPDGNKIAFASDRGPYVDPYELSDKFSIRDVAYKNYDIYELTISDRSIIRLTTTDFIERTPEYSPEGNILAFTSDRTGITNIYLKNLENGKEWAITDVLTGVFQPSWSGDGSRVVFTSFYNAGYDLYKLENPLEIEPGSMAPENTNFFVALQEKKEIERKKLDTRRKQAVALVDDIAEEDNKYARYVFDEDFAHGEVDIEQERQKVALDSSSIRLPSGEYRIKDYKVTFTPDIIYGAAEYSQFFGVQGATQLSISDVLGNHRINVFTNLFYDFRNSDYMVSYFYLPHRVDIGVGGYHNVYFFWSQYLGTIRDRNYGGSIYLSLPLSRYRRLDFNGGFIGIERDYLDYSEDEQTLLEEFGYIPLTSRRFLLTGLSWVEDTSLWGFTGPVNGKRFAVGLNISPGIFGEKGGEFATMRVYWRRYFKFKKEFNFVTRVAAGASVGKHPQQFFVGGVPNWLNLQFAGTYVRVDNIEDIYFASFEMPFRGGDYYELAGNRFLLVNLEFRFPLIRYLIMGWPLPLGFQDVRGALFMDIAGANYHNFPNTSNQAFKPFTRAPNGLFRMDDLQGAYGLGIRTNIGFFLLQFDIAWSTDLYRSAHKPKYYISLGAEF